MEEKAGAHSSLTDQTSSNTGTLVILDHLSGYHRGTRDTLMADEVRIGSSADVDIHFSASKVPMIAPQHALIAKGGSGYHIKSIDEHPVFVNDKLVFDEHLHSGDLIQLGLGGPLLKFRLYQEATRGFKTVKEAVSDCIDCAKKESTSATGRTIAFVKGIPAQAPQLSPLVRTLSLAAIVLLMCAVGLLAWQTTQLSQVIDEQASQLEDINTLWAETDIAEAFPVPMSEDVIASLRDSLIVQLAAAQARIEILEAQSGASQRVIAAASKAVIFLQGAYGFEDDEGTPLRIQQDKDGNTILDENGNPQILIGGNGPRAELFYTGTGFVVDQDNLILTNRHVAIPWEYDDTAKAMMARLLKPVMYRLIGYLPGVQEPFDVKLVSASDNADVAVLQCEEAPQNIAGLTLSDRVPAPGEEVIVMGYPTGLRALLARTNEVFVNQLLQETQLEFWTTAERLSNQGFIKPLSTRGIVGQVTAARIVYDAGTTHGGSGGPVLGLDGHVYAVNAAILPDFEGSNLGVPASEAQVLLSAIK
ncbi:MAG: trypsin-like peptidase domain-containing protein [Rhodothermales bacterium]